MPKTVVIDQNEGREAGVTLKEILSVLKTVGPAVSSLGGRAGFGGGGSMGSVINAAASLGGKGGTSDIAKLFAQFAGGGGGGGQVGALLGQLGGGQAAGLARMFAGMGGAGGAAGGAAGAGAAAGGVGALGGLAAAAGPVGAAFAVAHLAAEDVSAKFRAAGEAAKFLGTEARALAGNDHLGMLRAASEKAVSGLESVGKISPAAKVAAEGLKTATTIINEFSSTVDAFVQRGKELSKYDTNLAAANARADTARTLKDIEEAKALGESIGKLTDAQSRIENSFRDALLPVKQIAADILASVTEFVADFVAVVKPLVKFIADMLKAIYETLKKLNPFSTVAEALSSLRKSMDGEGPQNVGELNDMMRSVLQLGDLGGSGGAPSAAADRNDTGFVQSVSKPMFGTA